MFLHPKKIMKLFLKTINSICDTYNQQGIDIQRPVYKTLLKTPSNQIEEQRKDMNSHFKKTENVKTI